LPELPVSKRTLKVSVAAVFTALIAVATMSFSVSVPATRGYFNIGETAIYVSAILFGSSVGGLTGGLGSMIADLALGYAIYAPATLVIKGLEGAVVGFLAKREPYESLSPGFRRLLMFAATALLAAIIFIIGVGYYAGLMEFTLASPVMLIGFRITVPTTFWIALSVLAAATVLYVSLRYGPSLSWQIFAVLIGGAEMVTGYFIYEQFLLGVAAIAEVPINIGQMMIGTVVAIPLVRAIRSRIPQTLIDTLND